VLETEEFTQHVGAKRIYHVDHAHLDGSDLPVVTKPTWSLVQQYPDGSAGAIGAIETSPDGFIARFTAEHAGTVTVTVAAEVAPRTTATKTFTIRVLPQPPVAAGSSTLQVSQHRNGPIHH